MSVTTDWFEDDEFWVALYPHLFPQTRLDAADEQIDRLLKLAAPTGGDVLDLCCGPGRHAVALAKRGLRVTGVDRTQFLLDRAAARAQEAGVSIELVREDMRRFQRPAAFDLVVNLFTSFGYFDSRDDDRAVLAAIHGNLKPGGVAVFDMASKEYLCAHFQPTLATPPAPDGSFLVQRHQVIEDWARVKNDWLLIKDGATRAFTFVVRAYSGQELKDLLAGAGFASVTLFGALDGRPYGVDLERLIAVARKA